MNLDDPIQQPGKPVLQVLPSQGDQEPSSLGDHADDASLPKNLEHMRPGGFGHAVAQMQSPAAHSVVSVDQLVDEMESHGVSQGVEDGGQGQIVPGRMHRVSHT